MTHFTPVSALIGGGLIGLSAALLMVGIGRIAGVSGILAGSLGPGMSDRNWRIAFLVGLVAAPILGAAGGFPLPVPVMPASWGIIVAAGLLVGFGTRLGSGCTSGHGVCGIARLSPRSITATIVFMVTAMIVVFVMRHGG
jgi:hypothetical protein